MSFAGSREVIDAMPGGAVELLAGLPVRVLGSNCLDGRQHRLQVARELAAPLPRQGAGGVRSAAQTIEAMVPCGTGIPRSASCWGRSSRW